MIGLPLLLFQYYWFTFPEILAYAITPTKKQMSAYSLSFLYYSVTSEGVKVRFYG